MKTLYYSILIILVIFLLNSLKAQVNINIKHDDDKILQQDSLHANPYTTKKDFGDESKDGGATGDDEEIEIPGLPIFPSPKVTEMMKYTDFPTVDQYGGLPIQIPIYEINTKGLTHNIYLSYHSVGVTVGQEATWIGLGWNLQVGGSISRIVMDLPDDEVRNYSYTVPGGVNSHNVNVSEYGWLNNPDMIKNFPDIELGDGSYKDALYYNWNQQGESGNAGIAFGFLDFSNRLHQQAKHDCEPDIYYINVGNISVKFLFDFDGIPRLINPEQNLNIQYFQDDGSSDTRITSFIVKDNYGIEYHFGESFNEETTVKTKTWGGCTDVLGVWGNGLPDWQLACFGEYIINTPYTSAWYLEKIVSPKGREINFYYTKPTNPMKIEIPVNKCQANNSLGLNNSWNKTISIEQEINTCYLDYIEFQDRVIDFDISARTDVENGYQLDRIKIKESIQSNDPIYQYDFDYYYMNPAGTYNGKRLILDKFTQNEQKEYLLQYYGGTLPAKDSYQQDFWGYYSTISTGLVPKIFVYPQQCTGSQYRCYPISGQTGFTISGSDRTVDENNILTGVLRSITYPTRGKTIYEFESNEYFDDLYNGNIKGGGIRIAQIKKTDENDNILIQKSYEYNDNGLSSGVLIYDLAFATPSNYAPANNLTNYYYRWEQGSWSESQKHEYFTVRFTHNLYPPGNLDGYKIGYTNVDIIEVGNGKTVMEYHPPQNYKSNSPNVSTTPMNAWDFGWLDNSNYELIYPTYPLNTNTYTKECYEDEDENYWYIYTSPFNPNYPVYESTSWCTPLQNETVYTYDNLNYYGGWGGWFTPIGYQSGSLSLNQFWILNQIFNSDFLAYQSFNSDFLSENFFMNDESYSFADFTTISWGLIEEAGTNIFPYPPLTMQEDDDLIYSKLKSEIFYKEGETFPCKKKEYYYEIQGVMDEPTFGIVFNEQFVVPIDNKASPSDGAGPWDLGAAHFFSNVHGSYFQRKSWAKYYYKTGCSAFLDNVIETDFLTGGDVVKTTYFNYTDHYLISNIVEAQSNNSIRKELYKYPFNYISGIYSTMTNQNMYLYPIESLTTRDDFVISGVISTFKTDDGIIVPDIYYSFASTSPTPVGVCEFDGSVPVENYWNEKVIYDNYDNGDLVQYHLKDDIDISFIWAYNNQYPVISAKNIEQSALDASVNSIQSDLESFLADLGDLSTQNSIDNWKSFNIALREDITDAFITTYTYIPLVGITSETDPSGITTYYYYDSFNRLETIKDHNGNIIKHIDYHYKDE